MTDNHPITPPPELVREWWAQETYDPFGVAVSNLATQAARWGADQELEACCEWLDEHLAYENNVASNFRIARRPKPPSKKQRGLTALEATNLKKDDPLLYQEILNAIEGLPND